MIAGVTIRTDDKCHRIVTNVKKVHQRIIACFGIHVLEIYGLPQDLPRVEINYSNYKNLLHWCERDVICYLPYPEGFENMSIFMLMVNVYLFKVFYSFIGAYPAKFLVFLMRNIDGVQQEIFNSEFRNINQNIQEETA